MKASVSAGTILLVEDEMEMAAEIERGLERIGYHSCSVSIADLADTVRTRGAVLLILDRILRGVDSLRTLEGLRKQDIRIPALMISALSSPDEIAKGLSAGADDYLARPFHMVELVARIEALLRRLGDARPTKISFDDFEIDLIEQTAFRCGTRLDLSRREFKLLEYFLRHPGQIITRATLLSDLWHCDPGMGTNTVDAHVSNLRKKGRRPRPTVTDRQYTPDGLYAACSIKVTARVLAIISFLIGYRCFV